MVAASPGTRERLVAAMSSALQRRGFHGTGLAELLAEADAPKGVLYHHFPGGKAALAVASIEATAQRIANALDKLAEAGDPVATLRTWMASAQRQLAAGHFERGCPLATVALESTAEDVAVRAALADAFAMLRARIAAALGTAGVGAAQSQQLGALVVSAYEGALMQARVAGRIEPMAETTKALFAVIEQAVDAAAPR